MKSAQLFIPDRINVGFQNRGGTYTGRLAYVIYYDQKGKLRKETSWQNWRDKKIPNIELDNKPFSGFVLNKGVGGVRQSYGWNTRNEYIRVYDPRGNEDSETPGFEFEISVANLLFILRECDCSRGKGLEGEFVYAWDGTELVLLPVSCEDYQKSQEFTDLKAMSVKAKDLIPGATYTLKDQTELVYIGRYEYHFMVGDSYRHEVKKADEKGFRKKHIFWDANAEYDRYGGQSIYRSRRGKEPKKGAFVFLNELKTLAVCKSEEPIDNLADIIQMYGESTNGSRVVELFTKKSREKDGKAFWYQLDDGSWVEAYMEKHEEWDYGSLGRQRHVKKSIPYVSARRRVWMEDGIVRQEPYYGQGWPAGEKPHRDRYGYYGGSYYRNEGEFHHAVPYQESTGLTLWAKLESGAQFPVTQLTAGGN